MKYINIAISKVSGNILQLNDCKYCDSYKYKILHYMSKVMLYFKVYSLITLY